MSGFIFPPYCRNTYSNSKSLLAILWQWYPYTEGYFTSFSCREDSLIALTRWRLAIFLRQTGCYSGRWENRINLLFYSGKWHWQHKQGSHLAIHPSQYLLRRLCHCQHSLVYIHSDTWGHWSGQGNCIWHSCCSHVFHLCMDYVACRPRRPHRNEIHWKHLFIPHFSPKIQIKHGEYMLVLIRDPSIGKNKKRLIHYFLPLPNSSSSLSTNYYFFLFKSY